MLQKVAGDTEDIRGSTELPSVPRTKTKRLLNLTIRGTVPECYVSIRLQISQVIHPNGPLAMDASLKLNILWLLLCTMTINKQEPVPSWADFIPSTGTPPKQCTMTDSNSPVTNHHITDNKTVLECRRCSEEAENK